MAEALSPDDARILALESDSIAGHTLKLIVLEPGRPLDLDEVRTSVAARLEPGSRATQRVESSASGEARWVIDERFEIAAHVRRRPDTDGIDGRGLRSVASEIMSERLDHSRPLWAFDLVGPLADGREAIVARIHHAMADGISCVRLLDEALWDARRDAASPRRPGPGTQRTPPRHELAHLPGAVVRELGRRASESILDRPVGAARELAFTVAPLRRLHEIGASRSHHATVNDVLLAGVAGGLRTWLADARQPLGGLRAQIPVSLHHRDEGAHELGNRDSFLNVDLPLSEPDPLARLDAISAETAARKQLGDAEELYDLFHALGRCGPLQRAVERLAGGPHEFSLSVSNVPGPRNPVSVQGRSVTMFGSAAEPAARHALRVSAISCAGTVGIGLCTDPGAVPGVERLAAAIDAALAELGDASGFATR